MRGVQVKDESGVFRRTEIRDGQPEPTDDRCACCGVRMIAFAIPECIACARIRKATAKRAAA